MVVIKGGENIPNNTYGFEVEFCTHDCSVFAFTHVDVAKIRILFAERYPAESWTIETDSGNVLELVTPPLRFDTLEAANRYKDALTAALVQTVGARKTFREWGDLLVFDDGPVADVIREYYTTIRGLGQISIRLDVSSANAVGAQLTVANVDDGINIAAALGRFAQNSDYTRWGTYVEGTILSRSEKDYASGYSSQLNLPMTLTGYFGYLMVRKLPRAWQRMAAIFVDDVSTANVATDKLERWVFTWFWSAAIFTTFVFSAGDQGLPLIAAVLDARQAGFSRGQMFALIEQMAGQLEAGDLVISREEFGAVRSALSALATVQPRQPTGDELHSLALLYLKVQKALTGALGSLSETQQLALQERAFARGSTEVLVLDGTENEAVAEDRRWLEYHSAMKDLTGLWFKGALEQVCLVSNNLGPPLVPGVWSRVLGFYVSLMRIRRWDVGRVYVDELSQLRWQVLATAVEQVAADIGGLTLHACQTSYPLPERGFLDYAGAPPWEGRYDTMVDAIHHPNVGWTFLVEHRFN